MEAVREERRCRKDTKETEEKKENGCKVKM